MQFTLVGLVNTFPVCMFTPTLDWVPHSLTKQVCRKFGPVSALVTMLSCLAT